jgi:hypothetical protein
MSIVNGTSNANFNYQNTAITGWLCASVYGGGQPNNSAPEGELFYRVVTTGQPYSMYPVQNCNGQEGVTGSNTYVPGWAGTNKNGFYAILSDMTQVSTTKCQLLHH